MSNHILRVFIHQIITNHWIPSCVGATGMWACVCFRSISVTFPPLLQSETYHISSSKKTLLYFLPSFFEGRRMMPIPHSGGVEWQMTEGLIEQKRKREVTSDRAAAGSNGKWWQRSGTSIGRRGEVSDQIYWYWDDKHSLCVFIFYSPSLLPLLLQAMILFFL